MTEPIIVTTPRFSVNMKEHNYYRTNPLFLYKRQTQIYLAYKNGHIFNIFM